MTTTSQRQPTAQTDAGGALAGYEAELWRAADALRGSMDAADYKHMVQGLIFLKFISDGWFRQCELNWFGKSAL